ncbi:uncharacterized protein LOC128298289, partial [Anopheles moucheti]|uniref:uncharacterized protein LOC128298289 n=1 Tax=Anopheles moucheti TaxID=186751 RepID=UPI0022EFDC92
MPFTIVQTHGPKEYGELCIVPDSWVQGTSKKNYLFWPNVKGTIQNLIMDDNSVPADGWTKQECRIKRQGLSYADADSAMMIMSGESSSDSGVAPIYSSMRKPAPYAKMFSERVVENSSKARHNESEIVYTLPPTPPPASSSVFDENVITVTTDECTNCKTLKALLEAQTNLLLDFRAEQKREHEQVLKENKRIMNRLGIIEVQLNTLLNSIEVTNNDHTFSDHPFIASVADLEKLEKDLEDEEYFTQLTDLMKQQLHDKDVNNRMLVALDALFQRVFLTQCTWTGISKTGTKIAMHSYQNILRLFKCIGSTNMVIVTHEMVRSFFMKILKHAVQPTQREQLDF